MKHRQTGLTLIELMVALALTAVLGIMLAALVNGWLKVRERLQDTTRQISVLDFCLALERRFDSPVLRRVYDQRLPLASRWLDWQPASNQLLWVASTGLEQPKVARACNASACGSRPASNACCWKARRTCTPLAPRAGYSANDSTRSAP